MAGAPLGNNNAGRGREATNALEKALYQDANEDAPQCIAKFQALVDIWKAQIAKAKDGDVSSATMIIDRMEGRPTQAVDIGGQADNPLTFKEIVLKGVYAKPGGNTDT
jgi:hypothetical protein